jgi:hypothetical protein
MIEQSWLRQNGFPASDNHWLNSCYSPADNFIGEGQVTASKDLGIHILSKVRLLPYLAISAVNARNGRVTFDPNMDFVNFCGGEKKISIRYDTVSGQYYILANPILSAHRHTSLAPDLIRNTAALFSSNDLRHWRMEQIFLYSKNLDYEGFQYFNFDFDENDIVLVSRTAFDVGKHRPPRAHDSNLLTFHRITDFRTTRYQHLLRIQNGLVQRYEPTALSDAPLGVFPLGNKFEGAPLSRANGVAFKDGIVYIRERTGRVLSFDLMGNFLTLIHEPEVSFQLDTLAIPPAEKNQYTWTGLDDENWANPRNWFYLTPPQEKEGTAIFGSAANSDTIVKIPTRDRSWYFNQSANTQGWTSQHVDRLTVGPLGLTGTVANEAPKLLRTMLNFDGDEVSVIRVRMRVEHSGAIPVDLYWGTSTNDAINTSRVKRLFYTGEGEFQDLEFNMTDHKQWSQHRITQLRIDPVNTSDHAQLRFCIESIKLEAEYNHLELANLIFNNPHSYILTGGALRFKNKNGPSIVELLEGKHQIKAPIEFCSDTTFRLSQATELQLSGPVRAIGRIDVIGSGTIKLSEPEKINRLSITSNASVHIDSIRSCQFGAITLSPDARIHLRENALHPVTELKLNEKRCRQGTWGAIGSGADHESEQITGSGVLNVTGQRPVERL